MHVLDVRLNVQIDRDTLQKIMEQVMINSSGHSTDYEWMDLTQAAAISMNIAQKTKSEHKPTNVPNAQMASSEVTCPSSSSLSQHQRPSTKQFMKKRRVTNTSFSKKGQFMMSSSSLNKMKRCKSTGSMIFNKSILSNGSGQNGGMQHQSHDNHSGKFDCLLAN